MEKGKIFIAGVIDEILDDEPEEQSRKYLFTYDGDVLHILCGELEKIKPYDSLVRMANPKKDYEIMKARNTQGDIVIFINVRLTVTNDGFVAKPAVCIQFKDKTDKFSSMIFKGEAVNYFYRPNNIIDDVDSDWDYEKGTGNIKLKSYSETVKKYDVVINNRDAELILNVTHPSNPILMSNDYTLGKPESIIEIIFKESIQINEFKEIYLWIYRLLQFLNFKTDIDCYVSQLGSKCQDEVVRYADVYMKRIDEKEKRDIDNTIGYYFVSDHICKLLQILNTANLNLSFIPKNAKETNIVTSEKYLLLCNSFESVFNFVFPDAKTKDQAKAKEVKNEFLDYIERQREIYKGKDKRKREEFQKYADIITLLDFGLEEKIRYCFSYYKDYISRYQNLRWTKIDTNRDENIMIRNFVKKRNLLTHSGEVTIDENDAAICVVVRLLIYVMILDLSSVQKDLIVQAVEKIL